MTAPKPRPRQSKHLDAGGFQPEISSFRLHLAAEGEGPQDGPRSRLWLPVKPLDKDRKLVALDWASIRHAA